VEYVLLAGPTGDATLDLDHRQFRLAGDFVQSRGVAVVREPSGDGGVATVAATGFDPDRSTSDTVRIRAITVRDDHHGEGIGARLAAFTRAALRERGWARVLIAVATPVAYHALHKAGFGDTGETTGLRERVLSHPPPTDPVPYATGLRWYLDHDPSSAECAFIAGRTEGGPPNPVSIPSGRSEASPR
jgi:GNAT superfamily N-acetyltransferase